MQIFSKKHLFYKFTERYNYCELVPHCIRDFYRILWDSVSHNNNYNNSVSSLETEEDFISADEALNNRRGRTERRAPTLKGFLIGCIRCQRRNQRRANCNAHFPTDWYDTRLFLMALALLFLSIADAAMTLTLLNNGAVEVNPFMNFLLSQSTQAFLYTKLILTSICILVLVAHYHSKLFKTVKVHMLLTFALSIYSTLVIYELFLYFNFSI